MWSAGSTALPRPLIFPIGHQIGPRYRPGGTEIAMRVRRGASFHELTDRQAAVWRLAHGVAETINDEVPWQRSSVEERLAGAAEAIDELLALGLLVEVARGAEQSRRFAKSHRLIPLMLGLGNTAHEPHDFGIGFLGQPVLHVSHLVYDVWQWSTMDDSLWATCENATDVARRAGSTDPEAVDTDRLLDGFLGSMHALLITNAAYLDIGFRLHWPSDANPG